MSSSVSSHHLSSDHINKREPRTPDYRQRTPQKSSKIDQRSSSPAPRGVRNYNAGSIPFTLNPGAWFSTSSACYVTHQYGNKTVEMSRPPRSTPNDPPPWRQADSWRPGGNKLVTLPRSNKHERNPPRWYGDEHIGPSSGSKSADSEEPVYFGPAAYPPQRAPNDRTLPKNFVPPLTCFYWYTTGRCPKSDSECWYAHRDTGCVAAAPVRVDGREAAAGKQADAAILDAIIREDKLRARERDLDQRQIEVLTKMSDLRESKVALNKAISTLHTIMGAASEGSAEARRNLEQCRNALVALSTNSDQDVGSIITTLDCAIGTVAGLRVKLSDIEQHMPPHLDSRGDTEMQNSDGDLTTSSFGSEGVPIGS